MLKFCKLSWAVYFRFVVLRFFIFLLVLGCRQISTLCQVVQVVRNMFIDRFRLLWMFWDVFRSY